MVDAIGLELGVQGVPMPGLVGIEGRGFRSDASGDRDAFGFLLAHERQCASAALTERDNDAALAGLMLCLAAVYTVLNAICGANVTTDIAAINLDMAIKFLAVDLGSHRFAELVAENESRLVLAIQIAGHLQGGDAFRAVHEDADRRQDVGEAHLARGEDRAGSHREMVLASLALVFAAGLDEVRIKRAATRADRSAISFGPAQFAKCLVCLAFAAPVDGAQRQASSLCRL